MVGETGKPLRAQSMAGWASWAKGSLPKRLDKATQADTAPGTVTAFQPVSVMPPRWAKYSGVQAAGERPEALRPCSSLPSHRMAKPSLPMPQPVGSTTVSVMAAAMAASTALPPASSMRRRACAASGCEVDTTLRPITALRCEA